MEFSLFAHMERMTPDQSHEQLNSEFIELCKMALECLDLSLYVGGDRLRARGLPGELHYHFNRRQPGEVPFNKAVGGPHVAVPLEEIQNIGLNPQARDTRTGQADNGQTQCNDVRPLVYGDSAEAHKQSAKGIFD